MTFSEMNKIVNRTATFSVGDIRFYVETKDVRKVFNRIDVLIVPQAGFGERWVSFDTLAFEG